MKAVLELVLGGGGEVGREGEDFSSYFQTTIRMGKRDMQELTKRAVDMPFGVGFFGGAGGGTALLLKGALGIA